MYRCVVKRLPYDIDARTHLMSRGERGELVESQSIVYGQRRNELPFVLKVKALDPFGFRAIVDNALWNVADLIPGIIQCNDRGGGQALGMIGLQEYARPQGVRI